MVFEVGTVAVVWMMVKPEPVGLDGWNGVKLMSDEMTEILSVVWEVVTRPGGGRKAILQKGICP